MTKPPVRPLYTVEEAAPILRMSRSGLYRAIRNGRVTHTINPAGRIRLTPEDIEATLEAGRRQAAA